MIVKRKQKNLNFIFLLYNIFFEVFYCVNDLKSQWNHHLWYNINIWKEIRLMIFNASKPEKKFKSDKILFWHFQNRQ